MDAVKQQLLDQAYDEVMRVSVTDLQAPLEWIERWVDKGIMGYGTAMDEKILSLTDFFRLINNQRKQGEGFKMASDITPVFRRITADEQAALFVNEIEVKMRVEEQEHRI